MTPTKIKIWIIYLCKCVVKFQYTIKWLSELITVSRLARWDSRNVAERFQALTQRITHCDARDLRSRCWLVNPRDVTVRHYLSSRHMCRHMWLHSQCHQKRIGSAFGWRNIQWPILVTLERSSHDSTTLQWLWWMQRNSNHAQLGLQSLSTCHIVMLQSWLQEVINKSSCTSHELFMHSQLSLAKLTHQSSSSHYVVIIIPYKHV